MPVAGAKSTYVTRGQNNLWSVQSRGVILEVDEFSFELMLGRVAGADTPNLKKTLQNVWLERGAVVKEPTIWRSPEPIFRSRIYTRAASRAHTHAISVERERQTDRQGWTNVKYDFSNGSFTMKSNNCFQNLLFVWLSCF